MNKTFARIAVLASLSLLAIPSAASAAPTLWGGTGFNDLGPAYSLLSVKNGKASVKNVQLILACTDAEDGTESARAFTASFPSFRNLRANRFNFDFAATSGGRIGRVQLSGRLRSNGTGTARVKVKATAETAFGEIIERCQGEASLRFRRGG